MNIVEKFGSLSPAEKAHVISGSVFFVIYFALGIVFLFVKKLPFTMSPMMKTGFGIILVAYSCFRLSRITYNLRNAGKNRSDADNVTKAGK